MTIKEPPRHNMPGVMLERSELGGFAVSVRGTYVGWIHEHGKGDNWNAYRVGDGSSGHALGCWSLEEAIRKIAEAMGQSVERWPSR